MEWELEFIKLLQRGSNKVVDYFFFFITQFGTELFFMLAVAVLYWCVSKREAFRLVNLFMVAQLFVGFIKVVVKRPRPYTAGAKPILQKTDGYSFPSGHSNNIAVIGTDLTLTSKGKPAFRFVLITSVFVTLMVMLSRMYLGQHYPTDVLTGAVIGTALALIGSYLFDLFGDKEERAAFAIVPACICLLIFGIVMYAVKGDFDDSVITIAGTYSAAGVGYYLEKKLVGYEVKSDKIWRYFVRFIVGIIVALIIKEGLKALFNLFANGILSLILTSFIRYFLIGIWVTLLAPMLFKRLKI